ncbi:transcriptional coactivator/pterin dehydratase [Nemania abortiva]|nr:transcriptional coactivator/pterin dehydratase [Nemania abortiva]
MAEQSRNDVVHTKLKVSQGGDTRKIKEEVNTLVALGWRLDSENMGLETSFTFPTFAKAVDFIYTLFVQSKIRNHHAEVYNMYKLVNVHWTTHKPRGLSANDTEMARWCHEQAVLLGGQYNADINSRPNA